MQKFSRINLAETPIDKKTAALIPLALAERYSVIPVKISEKKLILAMTAPVDFFALDDVRLASGYEVEPVIAAEEDILRAIRQTYEVNYLVKKALSQIKPEEAGAVAMEAANDAPVINIVNSIISQATKNRASDIHLEPQDDCLKVRFRVDGTLRDEASFPINIAPAVISRIKIMSGLNIAEKRLPQDGRIVVSEQIDLRISTSPTILGEKVVMRILDKKAVLLDIENLGFSAENLSRYQEFYSRAYGMVLITGPTGSGKTTTLYSTLAKINSADRNIVTIEDPVEYRITGSNQIQINPKAGLTFANGLRSILRQDPDVIMVGEIRDGETADIAIRAALTGHLVFSTLHTNDAPGAVTRLLDMGVEQYLVSSAVLGIVAQRLVRLICPKCKESYAPESSSAEVRFLTKMFPSDFATDGRLVLSSLTAAKTPASLGGSQSDAKLEVSATKIQMGSKTPPESSLTLYRGSGCAHCRHTGYYGRIAVHEVMPLSPAIIDAVNRRASSDVIAAIAVREGMKTIIRDGVAKACQGITTVAEVMRVAM